MNTNNLKGIVLPSNTTHLNEVQLAQRWGVSTKFIQKLRYQGGGPAYIKIGRSVRYSIKNVELFEIENQHVNTSQGQNP